MHSHLLTTSTEDASRLSCALEERELLVVGLCAAWCGTCKEFRETFETLAAAQTDRAFVWLDVEDDADLAGDIEVENFPTLAIFQRDRLLHFGVSFPQRGIVARLLSTLDAKSETALADETVTALPSLLAHHSSRRLDARAG